jgi:hypothetical protein
MQKHGNSSPMCFSSSTLISSKTLEVLHRVSSNNVPVRQHKWNGCFAYIFGKLKNKWRNTLEKELTLSAG